MEWKTYMVKSAFKHKTSRNKKYLAYIQTLDCIVCKRKRVDAHHVYTGGVGLKCSDYLTIPLCREHHSEIHNTGKKMFQVKYQVNIKDLLTMYLKIYEEI